MDPLNQNISSNPSMQSTPPTPPNFNQPQEEHHSSAGPIIGSVIIVLIIVLGGLYLYGDRLGLPQNEIPTENEITAEEISAQTDVTTEQLRSQGNTDAIDDIEADLSATDLNALDAELANISAELSF